MILTNTGVLKLMQRIKSFITAQLNTKANSVHTHTISEIDDLSTLSMGGYTKSEVDTLLNGKSDTGHTHTVSDVTDFPTLSTVATSGSYNDLSNKPTIPTVNNATLTIQKNGTDVATFSANSSTNATANITVPTKTSDLTNDSGFITSDNTKIPLAGSNAISGSLIPSTNGTVNLGGSSYQWNNAYIKSLTINGVACGDILTHNVSEFVNVSSNQTVGGIKTFSNAPVVNALALSSTAIYRTVDDSALILRGGINNSESSSLALYGKDSSNANGKIRLIARNTSAQLKNMWLEPNGTWTWEGTAVQLVSDQRLKQQISEIDDKLLDAWEDVNLVQFKYNDAVDQKKDKARLHTGYVVQQIDSACQSHGVDVSQYGLYCHEEYPQETEEVEVEQADGTKVKERKVIREASEHYSLRYTETLVVECAYLRRENARLKQQMQQYTESLSKLEERLKALEQTSK